MKFKRAIVRRPGAEMVNGLTNGNLGKPDYSRALWQHSAYIEALKSCGLEVTVLEADPQYPDGCFVEDTAVLTERIAIITNPGAPSRKGEISIVEKTLRSYYTDLASIRDPGTLEGGDVMRVGDHFYIGLSLRTNKAGGSQLIKILRECGYSGSLVEMKKMLHLKTGLAYLGKNVLLTAGEFIGNSLFASFQKIKVDDKEAYAANCIMVNGYVLVAQGFPKICDSIRKAGFKIVELEMSEFQKLDGGLSCLSLRF